MCRLGTSDLGGLVFWFLRPLKAPILINYISKSSMAKNFRFWRSDCRVQSSLHVNHARVCGDGGVNMCKGSKHHLRPRLSMGRCTVISTGPIIQPFRCSDRWFFWFAWLNNWFILVQTELNFNVKQRRGVIQWWNLSLARWRVQFEPLPSKPFFYLFSCTCPPPALLLTVCWSYSSFPRLCTYSLVLNGMVVLYVGVDVIHGFFGLHVLV